MGDVTDVLEPNTVFSLAGVLFLLLAIVAGVHVVLNKQNEGAAFAWLGVILLSPLVGAVMYWLFGINRIRRRAQADRPRHATELPPHLDAGGVPDIEAAAPPQLAPRFRQLMRLGAAIHPTPYVPGNALVPLLDGDEGYPRMLAAIGSASESVLLSSYIFDHDAVGRRFVDALAAAEARGVLVRVLIDGVGVSYGFRWIRSDRALRQRGVRTARFLSAFSTAGTRFLNLRNHRKILVVDGVLAFVGGLNIRAENVLSSGGGRHVQDVHFEVRGPVVAQISAVFVEDWEFAAKESLELSPPVPPAPANDSEGAVLARVLLDGPDENYEKLQMTMVGAIHAARESIRVATPYFLPDPIVINALQLASLRGVSIEILVPLRNNLPFVGWAMQANQWKLADYGIDLFESPEPFDHSKLFLVDEEWTLIGSSNWDSRSLELNFEINLECYDRDFNARVREVFAAKRDAATLLARPSPRSLPVRLRNNFCRLFSPYL